MYKLPPCGSQSVEFKARFGDNDGHNIKKTLVAFANTFGGDLYIGIRDDRSICGVEDAGKTEERLWNMVRDNIYPSITGSVDTERLSVDGKTVIHVHVDPGQSRHIRWLGTILGKHMSGWATQALRQGSKTLLK